VIRVVEGGVAARAAARQFVIGDATAIRWVKRWRETGSFEARSVKGQSRSPLKKHDDWLLELVRQEPDLTLEEIQRRLLDERQQKAGLGSVWRFFDCHGISFKESVRAAEQDRPDVAAARTAWADNQPKLDPDRLTNSVGVLLWSRTALRRHVAAPSQDISSLLRSWRRTIDLRPIGR
jgi:transposase